MGYSIVLFLYFYSLSTVKIALQKRISKCSLNVDTINGGAFLVENSSNLVLNFPYYGLPESAITNEHDQNQQNEHDRYSQQVVKVFVQIEGVTLHFSDVDNVHLELENTYHGQAQSCYDVDSKI